MHVGSINGSLQHVVDLVKTVTVANVVTLVDDPQLKI